MTRNLSPHPHPMGRTAASYLAGLLTLLMCLVALPVGSAQAATAWPNVSQGATGANVTIIQHLVTAHGQSTSADGVFGSGTDEAVKAFQGSNGLSTDGIVGADTWSQLVVTVREGDSGSAVQAAQVALNKHGHGLSTDGAFGPATASAAVAFQNANGLAADGIIGPATWQELVATGDNGGSPGNPGEDYESLSGDQIANSRIIIGVAKGNDVPEYGQVIALAAAMQESRIQNIDYGDRDSQGLFQQRPSQGWGTVEEITTPELAARAFYGVATHTSNPGLLDISGWESMSVAQAADAVQRSCCPDAYAQWETLARDIVANESVNSPPL